MAYSWLTFAQLKTALSGRLGNSSFWIDAELGLYLQEALRTFQSIAQLHRDRVTFATQANFSFYDLTLAANPDAITAGTGSGGTNPPALVGYSLTDRNLVNLIQYHLIEHITTSWPTWLGTEQFTMDDVVRAIERRRNLFLLLTGLHVTHSQVSYTLANTTGRVSLSDSIIDVRRAAWIATGGTISTLWRTDEWRAGAFAPTWITVPTTPTAYSFYMTPKVGLTVIPVSDAAGTLDLLTINAPTNLDVSTGVAINVPDDFAWVIKFGAMSDLLTKDAQSADYARAAYCEKRWEEGIKYALNYALLNQVLVGSTQNQPSSIADADAYNQNWQNVAAGTSTDLITIGRNLVALSPTPNGVQTITLDVVRNAPVPTADGDSVQIGREQVDAILDYAVHLARFKEAGAEFESTYQLLDRFTQQAMFHNDRLKAEANEYSIMKGLSDKEDWQRPRNDSADQRQAKEARV